MRRRDLMKSAALVSAGAVAGLGGLSQFSRWAAAAGRNSQGAWASELGMPLAEWPLIPIHAALLGDGRLLTYGTEQQRAADRVLHLRYLGSPSGPSEDSHLTLPNSTQTDIFCSAQILLPQSGNVLVAGGDNWTGTATTNTGNNNSNIFSPGDNSLTRSGNMNRPRWYASPITLPDGQTYIQGGTAGKTAPSFVPRTAPSIC